MSFTQPNSEINETFEQERHRAKIDQSVETYKRRVLPKIAPEKTVKTLIVDEINQKSFSIIRNWNLNDDFGLLIIGPPGCGKTHILLSVANYILDAQDQEVSYLDKFLIFTNVADFLADCKNDFETGGRHFESARDARYLFLDDLGVENLTEWARDELYRLLEHRVNNKLPTFVSTNLSFDEIKERFHERILSRLKEITIFVNWKGIDRRTDRMKANIAVLIERGKLETQPNNKEEK